MRICVSLFFRIYVYLSIIHFISTNIVRFLYYYWIFIQLPVIMKKL